MNFRTRWLVVFKLINHINYDSVSRQQGFSGNLAGNEPSLQSTKQRGLDRNGIYISPSLEHDETVGFQSEITTSVTYHTPNMRQLFGPENTPAIIIIIKLHLCILGAKLWRRY